MEISDGEAKRILIAHGIEYDFANDPRSMRIVAAQFVLTNTVSVSDFETNKDDILGTLWQEA